MVWTIKDEKGNPRYQIRPNSGGLCYEVWGWNGHKVFHGEDLGAGWVFTGRYPSTLAHAYRQVGELAAIRSEGEEVVRWCTRESGRAGRYLDGWAVQSAGE
jgi:hypothetical protein